MGMKPYVRSSICISADCVTKPGVRKNAVHSVVTILVPGKQVSWGKVLWFKWNSGHCAFHNSKLSPGTHFLPTTSGSSNLMVNLVLSYLPTINILTSKLAAVCKPSLAQETKGCRHRFYPASLQLQKPHTGKALMGRFFYKNGPLMFKNNLFCFGFFSPGLKKDKKQMPCG